MSSAPDVVTHFVNEFRHACNESDGNVLYRCMSLDEQSFLMLKLGLASVKVPAVCAKTSLLSHNTGQAKRFKSLLYDFLEYVKNFERPGSATAGALAYDAWVKVYSSMVACFTLPDTVWLVHALKFVAQQLVLLGIRTDNLAYTHTYTKTVDAAGRLSKAAGLAANDRSAAPGYQTKRAAVLKLANLSFRAYFKLKNTRLCETVLGSVSNALLMNRRHDETDTTGETFYSLAERVTYHYYVGQIRLFQHRVQPAAHHLRWAFEHCTSAHAHNKRKILISLIAVQIILGRYPHALLLDQFNLRPQYGALVKMHRLGYGAGVMNELERHREWLRTRGLYMLLREKLVLGVWRNLIQRCMRLSPHTDEKPNAPPTLALQSLVLPARHAWNDDSLMFEDLECVAANLIDQGLMKAYILHSKGMIVLQRGPHRGFPPMSDVYQL